jgi:capsular exopolysaccharide synthesis family protein
MFSRKNAKEMELSVLQEAFRVLKSNILFCGKENKIKTITITSCNPGEGKTTIALNLATSLAYSGNKTLLVDAEFRKQKKPWLFKSEIKQAFSKIDFRGVYPVELIKDTSIKNLSYLSIGSSLTNPEMLIDSAQLNSFINDLSEDFDTVIIDAPPLGGVIDSALIAASTDATILVIQSRLHDYRTVLQMKEQLEKADVKLIGAALTKVDNSSFKSYLGYQKYCKRAKPKETLELEQLGIISENKLAQISFKG